MAKQKRFSDQIRDALARSGMTKYRIAKELGISESTLGRFERGAWLGKDNMDALADLLGLEVVVKKPNAKQKG